jgi:RimJ/RimL family protein N-acetyltransferase
LSRAEAQVLELRTVNPSLLLRESSLAEAAEYYALIERNRLHLTQFGNYPAEGRASLLWVKRSLARPRDGLRFGVWLSGTLIGRAELAPSTHSQFCLAYWLGRDHVGRGLMTASLIRLMEHARDRLGATAFFAGVTHGNDKSRAVLVGLGYELALDQADHTVFARPA